MYLSFIKNDGCENTTFAADLFCMELPLQNIRTATLKNLYQLPEINADVLRLDLIHPAISGNKWFKLKEYLKDAKALHKKIVLTFGGAYSNHILATAVACHEQGFQSVGIIRGEAGAQPSATLQQAREAGMQLYFISRTAYANKTVPDIVWQNHSQESTYLIPEGGFGLKGREGAAEILRTTGLEKYTHILTAVGTGTTLAGLVFAAMPHQQLLGISVLKNNYSLHGAVNSLLPEDRQDQFKILHDFHFGGYAKHTAELFNFMNQWYLQTGIPSDFVYTGKLFFAAAHLIKNNDFEKGSRLLLIHTGGMQGNRSLMPGTLIF